MSNQSKQQKKGMVDISDKGESKRVAIAQSTILMNKETFLALIESRSPKGDVFETAKIAGIMAAKNTPDIIPMCHPLNLTKVSIEIVPDKGQCSVIVKSEAHCLGRTGVEMEALTAASAAALTIYDMLKWSDKGMVISETKLLHKSGGTSGDYNA